MRAGVGLVVVLLSGCGSTAAPKVEVCGVPNIAGTRAELMFATAVPADRPERALGRSLLGAWAGAFPAGTSVVARDAAGKEIANATAESDGRFLVGLDAAAGDRVEITAGAAAPFEACVRDPASALAGAVDAPIDGVGDVPNDLVIVGAGDHARGVVVRSGDNAVNLFDLSRGLAGAPLGVRLPDSDDACGHHAANPWFAAPLDDAGARVAVTAYGQGRVYVVALDEGKIERVLEPDRAVTLDAPFPLARPVDVDCDGQPDSTVSSFKPRGPQGIARVGTHLAVGFSGFVAGRAGSAAPVYLPGVLAVWDLAALDAAPSLHVLPALDPQEVRALDDHRVLVTCSGVLDPVGDHLTVDSPGAVVIFDVGTGTVAATIDFPDFAPGTALVQGDSIFVGSLARGAVRKLALASGALEAEVALTDEAIDSVMRLVELPGGLVAAPSFDTDRLFVLDAATAELSPPPFFGPLATGPGRPIFDGLQVVARRPGRAGIDFEGPDLFALSGVASRVVPIELRRLLGP